MNKQELRLKKKRELQREAVRKSKRINIGDRPELLEFLTKESAQNNGFKDLSDMVRTVMSEFMNKIKQ
jgi:hypothetical protein